MTLTNLATLKGGRYSLISVVADDQRYSRVYLGADMTDDSAVAIKQAKRSRLAPRQRLFANWLVQREAQLLADLHHPGLPHPRDVFEEQETLNLVMDFIEGETLQARLDRLRLVGRQLAAEDSLHIGLQLCRVLAYLHGQSPPVIHRDLKPANVILGRGNRVFLVDFGIARRFSQCTTHILVAPSPRQARGLDTVYDIGSRGYAPREQYGRTASTAPWSDIYGLGALLRYLFSGSDPATKPDAQLFAFAPLQLAHLRCGASLAALIAQMHEDDPTRRPDIDAAEKTLEACTASLAGPPGIGTQARGQAAIPHDEAGMVYAG
jgi:serine/threonine protein kinase